MKRTIISLAILSLIIGCGGGSSSKSKGEAIDLADYFPQKNMEKRFKEIKRSGTDFEDLKTNYSTKIIVVSNINKEKGTRTITTTNDKDEIDNVTVIGEKSIEITDEDNEKITINRNMNIGNTIISESKKRSEEEEIGTVTYDLKVACKLEKKLSEFQKNDYKYTGDILEIKCITSGKIDVKVKESLKDYTNGVDGVHNIYDVSYNYTKKGMGDIADIDDNCISEDDKMELANDKTGCTVTEKEYEFYEGT